MKWFDNKFFFKCLSRSLSFSVLSSPLHCTRASIPRHLLLLRKSFPARRGVSESGFPSSTPRQSGSKRKRGERKIFPSLVAAHLEEQATARAAQQPRQAPAALLLLLRRGRHLPRGRRPVRRGRLHRVLRAVALGGHPRLLRPTVALRRDVVRGGASLGVLGVVAPRVVGGGAGGRVACVSFFFVFFFLQKRVVFFFRGGVGVERRGRGGEGALFAVSMCASCW